jgi:hypothetical protein
VTLWYTAFQMHSHPFKNPFTFPDLDGVVKHIWAAAVSTGISHVACSTMLEQVEGSRPLHDWSPVLQVGAGAGAVQLIRTQTSACTV